MEYAIKHGAQISSNSYGGQGNVLCQHYLATLKDVLSNAPNHLFVAAAGNVAGNNDEIVPVLKEIINQSLVDGCVPDCFKTALVKPLLKKNTPLSKQP